MPLRINFASAPSSSFEPWPIKEPVEFTIFEITIEKGKESGEPYLKFAFKQADGNRRAWRNFSLQPQSLWVLKKMLVEFGYDEEDLDSEDEFEFDPKELYGRHVLLTFGPEREYQGRTSQEVVTVSTVEDD